ncbi:hypothetical protein GE061_016304 [Apolygus lucorum]|uniref:Retrotransposon gag domain-containing protein n=1 Tax=Apolygus lucorum TaxID=248454 RepID=A0A6A4K160_APOLU|nr:hypothetical protein GE061_016304 [Apolygus lucorum]
MSAAQPVSAMSHVGFIGTLHSFSPKVNQWKIAKPRMVSFFKANSIEDEERKSSLFLNSLDEEGHRLIANLSVPKSPEEKTYKELIELFDKYFLPRESVFLASYKIVNATQEQNDALNEWLGRLRFYGSACQYSDLDDRILDQFVLGLHKGPIKDRLFEEDRKTLTLDRAMTLTTSREATLHQYDLPVVKTEPVYRTASFNQSKKGTRGTSGKLKHQQTDRPRCEICGNRHRPPCHFMNARCETCSII